MKKTIFLRRAARAAGVLCVLLVAVCCGGSLYAQQKPPRPIRVYPDPVQGLAFGAFFQGGMGGTVAVAPDGTRTTSGSLVGASFGPLPTAARFEVDAEPGTVITIVAGPDVVLPGSAGGTIDLQIGATSLSSPFVATAVPPARTSLTVGGTLVVGDPTTSPGGTYSGTFTLIFFQQ